MDKKTRKEAIEKITTKLQFYEGIARDLKKMGKSDDYIKKTLEEMNSFLKK